jgi:hypothetical protein
MTVPLELAAAAALPENVLVILIVALAELEAAALPARATPALTVSEALALDDVPALPERLTERATLSEALALEAARLLPASGRMT